MLAKKDKVLYLAVISLALLLGLSSKPVLHQTRGKALNLLW